MGHQQGAMSLDLPRSMGTAFSKSVGDIAATGAGTLSDISAGTIPKGSTSESGHAPLTGGASSSDLFSGENAAKPKERCKTRCAKSRE